jgi:hypothetical protein
VLAEGKKRMEGTIFLSSNTSSHREQVEGTHTIIPIELQIWMKYQAEVGLCITGQTCLPLYFDKVEFINSKTGLTLFIPNV